jgi:fucose 4-O-acetylase-like acetyltransferase
MERDSRESRLNWVDAAKGLGIVLVVIGHVIRGLVSAGLMDWTPTARFVDAWIYSFHMPLFFFLSGLFLCRSARKDSLLDFMSDKARVVAYPYVVWSAITVLLKSALGSIPNQPRELSDLFLLAYDPIEQYWFLYVLFVVTIVIGSLLKSVSPWLIIVIAIVAYPGILPFSTAGTILERVRESGIYIGLGVIVGSGFLVQLSRCTVPLLAALMLAGLGLPAFGIAAGLPDMVPVLAIGGTIGAVALALLLDRMRLASVVSFLGRYSLEIFVLHTIASAAVRISLSLVAVRSPVLHFLAGSAAGILVPIAMSNAFRMVGFQMAFTFPRAGLQQPAAKPL